MRTESRLAQLYGLFIVLIALQAIFVPRTHAATSTLTRSILPGPIFLWGESRETGREEAPPTLPAEVGEPPAACVDGMAGPYPCRNVDLLGRLSLAEMGNGEGNDIWGWTDPRT